MTRYTTPSYVLTIDGVGSMSLDALHVTFRQGKTIVTIPTEDLTVANDTVSFTLTQEQTGSFKANSSVGIQARGLLDDGTAWATNIIKENVYPALEEGVISGAQ